jgi:antitoxin (DNA-binding transcriptional repressor) of toxin-antitoxin stability system
MGFMSVRELNANVSRALSAAEAGEDIMLTRNGRPFLRITRDGVDGASAKRLAARERLRALMDKGIDFGGPASYEERTGR